MNQELWCGDCKTHHPEYYFSEMKNKQAKSRKFTQPRCKMAQKIRYEKWQFEQEQNELNKIGQLRFLTA